MLTFLICGFALLAALLGGAGLNVSRDDDRRFRPEPRDDGGKHRDSWDGDFRNAEGAGDEIGAYLLWFQPPRERPACSVWPRRSAMR